MAAIIQRQDHELSVEGDISFANVVELRAASRKLMTGQNDLQIDFSNATCKDSSVLALLIDWKRQAKLNHQDLKIVNLPESTKGLAEACGLKQVLDIL